MSFVMYVYFVYVKNESQAYLRVFLSRHSLRVSVRENLTVQLVLVFTFDTAQSSARPRVLFLKGFTKFELELFFQFHYIISSHL